MNVFDTPSPLLPIKNILDEYNLGQRRGSFVKRINDWQVKPEKLKLYEKRGSLPSEESDDEDKIELEEHEKERLEKERIANLKKTIELWLCTEDDGLIMNNPEIEGHFKRNESLQYLVDFVSEPLIQLIDSDVFLKNITAFKQIFKVVKKI